MSENHGSAPACSVPIDPDVERLPALGAAVLNRTAAEHVVGVRLDDWTTPVHRAVAATVRDLVADDTDPDPVLVAHRAGVDLTAVRDLFADTPAISTAGHYCTIVARLGRLRRIIHAAGALSTAAIEESDDDHLEHLLDRLTHEVRP